MSVAHATTGEHGDVPSQAAVGDHMDILGLCITALAPHWMWGSGELAPSLICGSTWMRGLCCSSRLWP